MNVFVSSVVLFTFAFAVHFVIWKFRVPQYQTKTLLQIFLGTFLIALPTLAAVIPDRHNSLLLPHNIPQIFHILLLFCSLLMAYIITYSALEVNSPSLVITKLIAEAGPEGLERNSLYTKLNDEILVLPRIRDLIRDNLAVMDGDKIKLTSRGKRFIRIFVLYRSLLNAEPGG
jgi:hypothetical protein